MARFGVNFYKFSFMLDHYYILNMRYKNFKGYQKIVRFEKVTEKGFNLVDIKTGRKVLKNSHLYDKRFSGKEIPDNVRRLKVWLPDWLTMPEKISSEGGVLYAFETKEKEMKNSELK